MSRQPSGRNSTNNLARGAGFAAAKGAGLIAIAIVIGIVLLNVVDTGEDVNPDTSGSQTPETTASETTEPGETTTPDETTPAKTPAELVVFVVNGGAPQGSAGAMSDALKVKGYTNQPKSAADWIDHDQTGNTVMCRAGLEREALALATAVGDGTPVPVEAMVEPPPTGTEPTDDCVVVVGAPQ